MKLHFDEKMEENIKNIAKRHNLGLVVLFGSQITDRVNKESDIDIGVYGATSISFEDKIILSKEFSEIFGDDNIDISIISSNSPLLMYQILIGGKILYEKEKNLADRLRLYSWKLLAEAKSFRDHSFSLLKNKITLL